MEHELAVPNSVIKNINYSNKFLRHEVFVCIHTNGLDRILNLVYESSVAHSDANNLLPGAKSGVLRNRNTKIRGLQSRNSPGSILGAAGKQYRLMCLY